MQTYTDDPMFSIVFKNDDTFDFDRSLPSDSSLFKDDDIRSTESADQEDFPDIGEVSDKTSQAPPGLDLEPYPEKLCMAPLTHTETLDDLNFTAEYVPNHCEDALCKYWHGKNRLYVAPGKEFTIRFHHLHRDAPIDTQFYIDIFPMYEDEARAHKPVLQQNADAGAGVVQVVDGAGQEIADGLRRGVRLSPAPVSGQVTLKLFKWDNLDSKKENLPVSLHFFLYDSNGLLRGQDSMQVRVNIKAKRKCKADKAKLEAENIMRSAVSQHEDSSHRGSRIRVTAQQDSRSNRGSRDRVSKRRCQTAVSDSDDVYDMPLSKRSRGRKARVPPTCKLQLELPRNRFVADILESLKLRFQQAARHSYSDSYEESVWQISNLLDTFEVYRFTADFI